MRAHACAAARRMGACARRPPPVHRGAWPPLQSSHPPTRLRPACPAGTITNAAKVLHAEGAREVYACATHAVFSPPAVERLGSGVFQEVIVTNTIAVPPSLHFPELTVLSVASLVGETIWRVYNATSVQSIRE